MASELPKAVDEVGAPPAGREIMLDVFARAMDERIQEVQAHAKEAGHSDQDERVDTSVETDGTPY